MKYNVIKMLSLVVVKFKYSSSEKNSIDLKISKSLYVLLAFNLTFRFVYSAENFRRDCKHLEKMQIRSLNFNKLFDLSLSQSLYNPK